MDRKHFEICGTRIAPGKRKRIEVSVAQLFDQTEMTIPIEIIHGKEDGPILLLSAAMHGDELNGCEAIKRVLCHKKLLSNISLKAIAFIDVYLTIKVCRRCSVNLKYN